MEVKYQELLKSRLDDTNYKKLMGLENTKLHSFVAEAVELGNPDSVFVCTDSPEDIAYIRNRTTDIGEETKLKVEGHTYHFDGPQDQARDKANTKYLVPAGSDFEKNLNQMDKEKGVVEVRDFLKDSMAGKQAYVRFFCLGPVHSEFSISGVQVTDSAYVAHSEDLLYRPGYGQFKRIGNSPDFFRVLHSAGALSENNVSANVDKRRVYIDFEEELVYSVNTQYAGNTVGFKKLSHRLAMRKADREGWLAEHMFLMGVHGPNDRVTYFSGAYPSACGKTSTSMIKGESIIGDDLAYLRKRDGKVYSVNVESGIFGIIQDVTAKDDPVIWDVLMNKGEVIFSNVLITDGKPYWLGDGREHPDRGVNFAGEWTPDKKDGSGNAVPAAHKNARYTIRLADLANLDEKAEDANGVELGGIIYGGRDSDTWVPVQQSFDWEHGVFTMGASLESETTSATLGAEGVRAFQPMANLDFISMKLGKYLGNHINFIKDVDEVPVIFASNYFMKGEDGKYLTGMNDKNVWVKWMELRVNGDVEAIEAPTGYIPKYEDLAPLFKSVLGADYTKEQYVEQFSIRVPECLAKLDRIEDIYRNKVSDTPEAFFKIVEAQRERLKAVQTKLGDKVSPFNLAG